MNAKNTAIRVAESVLGTSPRNMNAAVRNNIALGANVYRPGPPPGLPTLAQRRAANIKTRVVGVPLTSTLRAAAPEWTPAQIPSTLRAAAPEWTPGAVHHKSRKNQKTGRKSRKNHKGNRK